MRTLNSLFGRSVGDWCDINEVLDRHRIKDAKELDAKLTQPKVNERRIEVRDEKNTDRLLGTMPEVAIAESAKHWRAATMSRIPVGVYGRDFDDEPVAVKTVTLTKHVRGWKVCFVTTDTLDDLMRLRDFRLPGESEEAAHQRHYMMD
jgi:hypothetical protein